MLLESAKVCNFKSIGKENNVLYVERSVTALIGKNESGKSNVLESLGLLNLWSPLDANYLRKLTRGQDEQPTVSLVFSFSERDRVKDTLFGAFEAITDAAQHTNKKRIIPKIEALVKEFNNFYSQEEISLDFSLW